MNKSAIRKLLLFSGIALLTSCGLWKKETDKTEREIALTTNLYHLSPLVNEFKLQDDLVYIRGRGKMKTSSEKHSFRIEIRISKDREIWADLSDPILGLKIIRTRITPDTISIIHRLNKEYLAMDWESLNKKLDTQLNFRLLQAAITGNALFEVTRKDYELTMRDELYTIVSTHKFVDTFREYRSIEVDTKTLRPKKQSVSLLDQNRSLEINNASFEETGNSMFPSEVDILISGLFFMNLELEYDKIEVREELDFPFTVPKNYEHIR